MLLARRLRCPVAHLASIGNQNRNPDKFRPKLSRAERARLLRLNWVDARLYGHFAKRFALEWNATDEGERLAELDALRRAVAKKRNDAATRGAAHVHVRHSPRRPESSLITLSESPPPAHTLTPSRRHAPPRGVHAHEIHRRDEVLQLSSRY